MLASISHTILNCAHGSLPLKPYSFWCLFLRQLYRDLASGTERYLDVTFGMQVVESFSLVSVLFREAFSHPYIPYFDLLVNGFSVTCFRNFFEDPI